MNQATAEIQSGKVPTILADGVDIQKEVKSLDIGKILKLCRRKQSFQRWVFSLEKSTAETDEEKILVKWHVLGKEAELFQDKMEEHKLWVLNVKNMAGNWTFNNEGDCIEMSIPKESPAQLSPKLATVSSKLKFTGLKV